MTNERAQAFSEKTREHVCSSVNHVHCGASTSSLFVYLGTSSHKVCDISDVNTDLVISVFQNYAMKRIVNVLTSRRIHRANVKMPQVPPSRLLSVRDLPVLSFFRKAVEHLLAEWSLVDIELMEDHISLSSNFTLFAHNFDELP